MAYTEGSYQAKPSSDSEATEAKEVGRAAQRYNAMWQAREPFLRRARQCAELTIPYLIPPQDWTGTSDLYTPFQGVGSKGVNHLTSKLMLSLFPPNSPFARLRLDGRAEDQAKKVDPKLKSQVEAQLADIERKIAAEVETQQYRPRLAEGIKHLIVGGNTLLCLPEDEDRQSDDDSMRVFRLDKYVVKRDPSGNVLEICVKEPISPKSLTKEFHAEIQKIAGYKGDDKTCDLYTYIYLEDGMYEIFQEVHGLVVPGSEGSYPRDKMPWLALRWHTIDGEDYGRGYVEDLLGDLQSTEGLTQAIVEGSAAAAKVLFFVNPNGSTKIEEIQKAPNGAVRYGNGTDITVLRLEKQNDFSIANATSERVERRLAQGFLLNSSAQRQGDRVTAEEWRFMIQELEESLGGIYSILSHSLQLPLVKIIMFRMEKKGTIPTMKKGTVRPIIVTGLEALGRGNDLQKLKEFIGDAIQTLTPQVAQQYLNIDDYLQRLATGAGLDPTGLIKTKEEMDAMMQEQAQQQQQAQMMDMIKKLGPAGIKAMADQSKGTDNGGSQEPETSQPA